MLHDNPGVRVPGGTAVTLATEFCRQYHFSGPGGANEASGFRIPDSFRSDRPGGRRKGPPLSSARDKLDNRQKLCYRHLSLTTKGALL